MVAESPDFDVLLIEEEAIAPSVVERSQAQRGIHAIDDRVSAGRVYHRRGERIQIRPRDRPGGRVGRQSEEYESETRLTRRCRM